MSSQSMPPPIEDGTHPMTDRVWQQEERLCRMLDHLGIPAYVAARSRGGLDFERACEVCLGCWAADCATLLDGRPAPAPEAFCPNWPLLAAWLEAGAVRSS